MRTRNMSYKDHDIEEYEKQYILDFCRNADDEEDKIIRRALSELNPYISNVMYDHLTKNISYEKMLVQNEICMRKEDFYGYRRKCMGLIKRWMIWHGIWNCRYNNK